MDVEEASALVAVDVEEASDFLLGSVEGAGVLADSEAADLESAAAAGFEESLSDALLEDLLE